MVVSYLQGTFFWSFHGVSIDGGPPKEFLLSTSLLATVRCRAGGPVLCALLCAAPPGAPPSHRQDPASSEGTSRLFSALRSPPPPGERKAPRLQPATCPVRLVGSLPYGAPHLFPRAARRSGRGRVPPLDALLCPWSSAEPPPGPSVFRGDISGRAPLLGAPVSPPCSAHQVRRKGISDLLRSGATMEFLFPFHPQREGGPWRQRYRRPQPATVPVRLVDSLPYGTLLTFPGTARCSGRSRAPTTRCSAPSPRAVRYPRLFRAPRMVGVQSRAAAAPCGPRYPGVFIRGRPCWMRPSRLGVYLFPGRLGTIFGCFNLLQGTVGCLKSLPTP
ncbi:hypothetical protein NDU88_003005 [Pleurodeles waltl]|uniref:Uncharacterized protein n=1 Tax=Pleurodeles waltl TaxID=8319 RepID=A0AAV7PBP2_PLEWA|nr:hypothetical protein NDU88_003005 [Pleurodeles waltl]